MTVRQLALDLAKALKPTASNIERVAKQTGRAEAAWAFTQWRLRRKAEGKFALAHEMLFVAEALEQATHEEVARYHASRFPEGALVADLTCGIGGDLIALARRGPAVGYEINEERAECARHNVLAHGLTAEVRLGDGSTAGPFEYALADPARRIGGRRTLNLEEFEPNPIALAERFSRARLAAIKLSPMLADQALESLGTGVEFVSFGGECREALVWLGSEAQKGRWAVHVESGERLEAGQTPPSGAPDQYFYEADPAAVRAHCLGALCLRHGLVPLGESNGYLSGKALVDSPWLTAFETLEPNLASEREVRSWLKRHGAKLNAVKTRGARIDPQAAMSRLKSDGGAPVELAVYPAENGYAYAILRRL